ncbi:OsmC family protein [Paracoccus sp. M683]|uniref:OsmC family protein n=1 Tax=Paracoccus sp. M683 TaxID=2594268 RepID=UPI00163D9698|nr:OsmC family protein [Paracoccus sp. M683]
MITKSGSAKWDGNLKQGKGLVSTQSGVLKDQPYGFNTRFEGGAGTNPEELVGAAHAACFSMALSAMLEKAGITNTSVQTTSEITLDREGDGFKVSKAHLTTQISGDGDRDQMLALASEAEKGCPISKLMNAEITLDATVV